MSLTFLIKKFSRLIRYCLKCSVKLCIILLSSRQLKKQGTHRLLLKIERGIQCKTKAIKIGFYVKKMLFIANFQ